MMALAASGQLYSWGMGMDGRLGHGDIAHRDGPTLVAGLEDAGVALLSIAAGTSHSLAADAEGTLWTWGCGLEGALGLGESDAPVLVPTRVDTAVLTPSEQPDGAGRQVRMLAAGNQCSAAVTVDGRLFTWGVGAHYTLGLGDMQTAWKPTEVQTLRFANIKAAAMGPRHAAAVGEDGVLYTWGSGAHGRLGHGDGGATHRLPTPVSFFEGRRVVDVSICHCDGCATAAVTEDGACFTWGAAHSALGNSRPDGAGDDEASDGDQGLPRSVEGPWHRVRLIPTSSPLHQVLPADSRRRCAGQANKDRCRCAGQLPRPAARPPELTCKTYHCNTFSHPYLSTRQFRAGRCLGKLNAAEKTF